ncbi:MAG: hypothetical protein KAY22_23610 [Rhizorhabdus sp.]|uniref:hypothetical protein n=1 Tax=Rhizorhabdus sp. TaxID=1968843 RepID=UPI001B6395D4|nr:hypothetical protein [Rhizorhabdus sp.]MBP8235288.1 hypothetical protein [Rhizorhabdus sp.]
MGGLETAFLLACIFPYTQIIPLGSYNQPYALLFGGLLFLLRGPQTLAAMRPLDRWAVTGLFVAGVLLFSIIGVGNLTSQDLKYFLNYLTPFLLVPAAASIAYRNPDKLERILRLGICAWAGVALVQQWYPNFLTFLVGSFSEASEASIESGRGVLGLAPEPTHHGFHMVVLAAAYAAVGSKRWPIILCLVDALLLARSASVILSLAMGGLLWCCLSPRRLIIPAALGGGLLVFGIGFLAISPSEDSRILSLVAMVLQNPGDLLLVDYSVNARLGGMLAGLGHIFSEYMAPHGMSHADWLVARVEMIRSTPWLIDISTVGIPSGFGVILYQGGWLVAPMLAMIIYRLAGGHRLGWTGAIIVSTIFVFLVLYYLASPDFSVLYGAMAARAMKAARTRPMSVYDGKLAGAAA